MTCAEAYRQLIIMKDRPLHYQIVTFIPTDHCAMFHFQYHTIEGTAVR